MSIKVTCPSAACGKTMSVKDQLAGKVGKCPACGAPIKVPAPARPMSPPRETAPQGVGSAWEAMSAELSADEPEDGMVRPRSRRLHHQRTALLILVGVIGLGVLAVSVGLPWLTVPQFKDLTMGGVPGFKIEYVINPFTPSALIGQVAIPLLLFSLLVGVFVGVALFVERAGLLAASAFTGAAWSSIALALLLVKYFKLSGMIDRYSAGERVSVGYGLYIGGAAALAALGAFLIGGLSLVKRGGSGQGMKSDGPMVTWEGRPLGASAFVFMGLSLIGAIVLMQIGKLPFEREPDRASRSTSNINDDEPESNPRPRPAPPVRNSEKQTSAPRPTVESPPPQAPNFRFILQQADSLWFGKSKKARYWYPGVAAKAQDAETLETELTGKEPLRYGQTIHIKTAVAFDGDFNGYEYLGGFADGVYYWNKTPKVDSPQCLLWKIEPAAGSPRKMDVDETKSDNVMDRDRIRLRNVFYKKQFLYPRLNDPQWGELMATIEPVDDASQKLCEFTILMK